MIPNSGDLSGLATDLKVPMMAKSSIRAGLKGINFNI
jgi:hypothetical protein